MKKNKTYLKKTYLGPKRRVWHHLGPFSSSRTLLVMSKGLRWPSLGAVGLCGPALAFRGLLWAFVGLRWPSLGAVGLRGPALAFRGLLWAFVGRRWCCGPLLAVVGCCGPSLAVVGCCGPSWACVGLRWPSLAAVGFRGLSWWCGNSLGPEKPTNESQRLVGGGGRSIGPTVGEETQRNSPTSRRDSLVEVRG